MDHEIYERRPNVIVVQKKKNIWQIMDFACPYHERVDTKELGKIKHYQDLAPELRKIWNMKVMKDYTTSDRRPRNNT